MGNDCLFLGNDLVLNENDCNLTCKYCLTGQSNYKKIHEEQLIFKTPMRDAYTCKSGLSRRIDLITQRLDSTYYMPLLKITGGEVFLIKNILDFIEKAATTHETVIIQTNGVLISDIQLERLKNIENIVLQISLDSHKFYGNSYRVQTESLHVKIVEKIKKLMISGLPIEIYSVLNNRSVADMHEFAAWVQDVQPKATYFPFPVRGPTNDTFQVEVEQVKCIENFLKEYEKFSDILPPKPYFQRLLSFYQKGKRTFRCHLPRLVMSSFSDGELTVCPNIWFDHLGNITDDESWSRAQKKVANTNLYNTLLSERPRLEACQGCFTPWDTLSMYFDGEISLDELCQAPTYAKPKVRKLIKSLKEKYLLEKSACSESSEMLL